jgi:hypothetical protein
LLKSLREIARRCLKEKGLVDVLPLAGLAEAKTAAKFHTSPFMDKYKLIFPA